MGGGRSARGVGGGKQLGHPGPRAEQMSATTCFLTPVRVLVTLRKRPAEKFMTLGGSCPPSKALPPPPPPPPTSVWLPVLDLLLDRPDSSLRSDHISAPLTPRNVTDNRKYGG